MFTKKDFDTLKEDANALLKDASIMTVLLATNIKKEGTVKRGILIKLKKTIKDLEIYNKQLISINERGDKVFSNIKEDTTVDEDSYELSYDDDDVMTSSIEVMDDYVDWIYQFTSNVMVNIEEFKNEMMKHSITVN